MKAGGIFYLNIVNTYYCRDGSVPFFLAHARSRVFFFGASQVSVQKNLIQVLCSGPKNFAWVHIGPARALKQWLKAGPPQVLLGSPRVPKTSSD